MKTGGPPITIQQLGHPVMGEAGLGGCYELRAFFDGCDYIDTVMNAPVACIGRRLADKRIFASPDYRFCTNEGFEVLWLHDRRKRKHT